MDFSNLPRGPAARGPAASLAGSRTKLSCAPPGSRERSVPPRKILSFPLPEKRVAECRPSGPELLAEDQMFKQLLQRDSPDPAPPRTPQPAVSAPPSLGMVGRLAAVGLVVGMVAAVLAVIPRPGGRGAVAAAEAPMAPSPPIGLAPVLPALPAAAGVTVVAETRRPSATRVASLSVRHGPPAAVDRLALDADEVARLVKRGEDLLALGDIAAARLVLARAAAARDPQAVLALGSTYDPATLKQLHVLGVRPDLAQARAWYEQAEGYGSAEATARLAALPRASER
jgi:hypothetical protein